MGEARCTTIPMTVAEFRRWADRQPGKWELVDGEPRAMAPASFTHSLIQAQATILIGSHLNATRSPCRVGTEAAIVPTSFRRHDVRAADVAVTCSPMGEDGWEIVDPVFVLQVLSPTNEGDTRANVWACMTMPSVQQILLLASTAIKGEMFARQRDGTWPEEAVPLKAGDIVHVEPIGFACTLAEFYARTALASG